MANTLRFKRGIASGIPTALAGEPLFTTDTFDLYIGNGTTNTRFQKYIASGATTQILRGDGSLYTFPLAISSPSNGQVLKYNGTSWVNDSDAGITGSGTTNYLPKFTGASTLGNSLVYDNGTNVGIGTASPSAGTKLQVDGAVFVNRSGNVNYVLNSASSHYGFIQNDAGNKWSLSSGTSLTSGLGTAALTWFSTGNVSIGNLSDNGLRFQVTGDGYFSGNLGLGGVPDQIGYGAGNILGILSPAADATNVQLGVVGSSGATSGSMGDINFFSKNATASVVNRSLMRSGIDGATNSNFFSFWTMKAGSLTEKLRLDASGNLGVGVTPSAWSSAFGSVLQFKSAGSNGGGALTGSSGSNFRMFANTFYDGSYKYIVNGAATQYEQDGYHAWSVAPSGTAGNAITFTQAMRLDASGNLGLAVTPSAWGSIKALQIQAAGFGGLSSTAYVTANAYFDGSAYKYINSEYASLYTLNNTAGQHQWSVAPSGTAGNAITFTQAMTLTANSRLLLNQTSDTGEQLQVNGTAKITGNLTVSLSNGSLLVTDGTNNSYFATATTAGNYAANALAGDAVVRGTNGVCLAPNNGGAVGLRIASTGAATFSSSVTAASGIITGNLTVDTNTLFVDATNDFVGVGTTTSVGYKLDVNGTGRFTDNLLIEKGQNTTTKVEAKNTTIGTISDAAFIATSDASAGQTVFGKKSSGVTTYKILTQSSAYWYNGTAGDISIINDFSSGAIKLAAGGSSSANLTIASTGAATFSSSIEAATAIAIGTTPDTNNPFKILKNINATVGIKFENTNTSSSAFSAVQIGTDVTGGTKFTNLVYASSGISASGVYNPDGTSLINNGNGGLNFLGNPIRFYTGGSNGVLRWDLVNDGYITHYSATAPTTSATDGYRQYSADVVAGNAAPHFRTENGAVIKLYQETTAVGNSTISVGGGNAVLDDTEFDGYTLRQIVKALRNQGILA
jgi:hypothetical protein